MSNVVSLLERRLEPACLGWLKTIADVCSNQSSGVYLVGGVVRDVLLGLPVTDLDVSVTGLDEALASDLAYAIDGRLTACSQFNTFKIEVDSFAIDMAMTRQESYAHPGALPSVSPGSVDQDLARRDFSVNAMAIDLSHDHWGDLYDPMGGQVDLENRIIRILHAESFADDPTRIFRAVRYSQRLGFALEEATANLLKGNLDQLYAISGDRVRHELQRVFDEAQTGPVLRGLQDLGVLSAVFGPLGVRAEGWLNEGVFPDETEDLVWLAGLASGLTSGEASQFVQRLNMDSTWRGVVQDVVGAETLLGALEAADASRSFIYRTLHQLHPSSLFGVSRIHASSRAGANITLYLDELRHVSTELTGHDLIAMGVAEGPVIGRTLEALLDAQLDGQVSDRQGEEALVMRMTSPG